MSSGEYCVVTYGLHEISAPNSEEAKFGPDKTLYSGYPISAPQ
jgi:hypothetical protein